MELLHEDLYNEVREAAEVHKQTRQALQEYLQPGISLMEIAHRIESSTYALVKKDGTKRGWAFPTGLSLNHIAAHFSPNANDTTVLGIDDVLKVYPSFYLQTYRRVYMSSDLSTISLALLD